MVKLYNRHLKFINDIKKVIVTKKGSERDLGKIGSRGRN